ncbi:hypothetical protein I4U23_003858 [Adineta vaga]|nr:hypothetical protein I4U23_003858 [Adineta vaga]
MATNHIDEFDLNQRRRKIFIQNLNPNTTKQSLENYFSAYDFEWVAVPKNDKGYNQLHGIVTFKNKESVDAVMAQRIHRIDDKEVFIHRSVPKQGSAKDSYGIKKLIVSTHNNQSLLCEADIENHFSSYGKICDIVTYNSVENTWTINFDYYDSVDRILLDAPHRIGKIDVYVKKGDRTMTRKRSPTPGRSVIHDNNNTLVMPKKPAMKQVTINSEVSCFKLPKTRYCIHIKGLPNNIDSEILSQNFDWDICDLLMDTLFEDGTSQTQCWLKNANDEKEVDDFIKRWNEKKIDGLVIHCEKEEDELELCNKFQYGRCGKNDDYCHWEHITCTANGNCASTCPYGHPSGMKSENRSLIDIKPINSYYRIKMTGFKTEITPNYLTQKFGPYNYYIDRRHDRIGYIVKIRTMKYAKQLMTKWHNKPSDGQTIKCQLELNPKSADHSNHTRSRPASINGDDKSHGSQTRLYDAYSLRSSDETSRFADTDDTTLSTVDNREIDRDRLISGRALRDIASSLTNPLPSDVPVNQWEVTKKAPNSDEKVLTNCNEKAQRCEKCQPFIIEPQNLSNNLTQQRINNDKLWIIMERAPGCSLKEFIERTRNDLDISMNIQLTLKLTDILRDVHKKGIFHQNLSPDNIMIEWNLKSSIDDAQITVINFNQAVLVSDGAYTSTTTTSTEKWYNASQSTHKAFTTTIDASSICAILYWLLTQINPRHDNGVLPHQHTRDQLDRIISHVAKSINMTEAISLEEQLKRYLMNTFDRAFGFPSYHPWTIDDLECRLKSILQLLIPTEPKLNTIESIFQELALISNTSSSTNVDNIYRDVFEKTSKAFCQAKQYFIDTEGNQYEWSDGHCGWIYHPQSSINECYNEDILTYHSIRGRTTVSYSIIVKCLANCSEEGRIITFSMSSDVNGRTIEIPIGEYSTAQDYNSNVEENFGRELKNLLLAVYKERKVI